MAQQPANATANAAAKRQNVHKFRIDGHIPTDPRKTASMVAASDAVNAALEALKKAGAVITKDDALFTNIAADGSDDE